MSDEYSDFSDDDVTISHVGTYTWDKYDPQSIYGVGDEDTKKYPCEYCGRKFYLESLERHKFPCYRDQEKKRKLKEKQDAKKASNSEQADLIEKLRERRRRRVRNWKAQHIEFISAVQCAKEYTRAKDAGEPLPEFVPSVVSVELTQCKTCARKFNISALHKHAPRCKEESLRRQRESAAASAASKRSSSNLSRASSSRNFVNTPHTPLQSQQTCPPHNSGSPYGSRVSTPKEGGLRLLKKAIDSDRSSKSSSISSVNQMNRPTSGAASTEEEKNFNRYVKDQISAFMNEEAQWKRATQEREVRSTAECRATPTSNRGSTRGSLQNAAEARVRSTAEYRSTPSPTRSYSREAMQEAHSSSSRAPVVHRDGYSSSPPLRKEFVQPNVINKPSNGQLIDLNTLLHNPGLLQTLTLMAQSTAAVNEQSPISPSVTRVSTPTRSKQLPSPLEVPPSSCSVSGRGGDAPSSNANDQFTSYGVSKASPQCDPIPPVCIPSLAKSETVSLLDSLPKFCHECGLKFPSHSMKFCSKCGTRRQCVG